MKERYTTMREEVSKTYTKEEWEIITSAIDRYEKLGKWVPQNEDNFRAFCQSILKGKRRKLF